MTVKVIITDVSNLIMHNHRVKDLYIFSILFTFLIPIRLCITTWINMANNEYIESKCCDKNYTLSETYFSEHALHQLDFNGKHGSLWVSFLI